MSNWNTSRLDEVCSLIKRGIGPKYTEDDSGVLVINQRCIRDQKVSFENARLNDLNEKKIPEDSYLSKYDVLINSTGVGTLGRVAQILKIDNKTTVDSHVTIVRLNDNNIDPFFFGMALRFRQRAFEALGEGSTGQTELSRHRIGEIEIDYPKSISEQKAIAHILGKLDDKIELNRQMNQTLEAMAQALFKSWYVDFDPVLDNALAAGQEIPEALKVKAEKRKLVPDNLKLISKNPELAEGFPSSFVFNETADKWIPEGWEVKNVENALEVNPKVSVKKGEMAKFVDMKSLPTKGYSVNKVIEKEYKGGAKFNLGDILLARITPCLENGKTAVVDFLEDNESGFGSTEFIVMRGKNAIKTPYVACLARFEAFVNHCIQNMVGSSGRQRVQNSCFDSYYLVLPKAVLLDKFNELTIHSFSKITSYSKEIKTLTQLRDTLLPQLISGKFRVPENLINLNNQ